MISLGINDSFIIFESWILAVTRTMMDVGSQNYWHPHTLFATCIGEVGSHMPPPRGNNTYV
jgi:hypothetical protein